MKKKGVLYTTVAESIRIVYKGFIRTAGTGAYSTWAPTEMNIYFGKGTARFEQAFVIDFGVSLGMLRFVICINIRISGTFDASTTQSTEDAALFPLFARSRNIARTDTVHVSANRLLSPFFAMCHFTSCRQSTATICPGLVHFHRHQQRYRQ